MDKLAQRLKGDALLIDAEVSPELERRIDASLRSVQPEKPAAPLVGRRPATFWWASSLTGVAAALAIIAVVNFESQPDVQPAAQFADTNPVIELTTPMVDWKAESAMLTEPLQQELLDLQADIKKAEQKVKRDIGL